MPRNQFQRMVFAFITVVITVHAYVLENLLGSPAPFKLACRVFNPENEQEAIANIFHRMDEIKEELAHERRRRKALENAVQDGMQPMK